MNKQKKAIKQILEAKKVLKEDTQLVKDTPYTVAARERFTKALSTKKVINPKFGLRIYPNYPKDYSGGISAPHGMFHLDLIDWINKIVAEKGEGLLDALVEFDLYTKSGRSVRHPLDKALPAFIKCSLSDALEILKTLDYDGSKYKGQ